MCGKAEKHGEECSNGRSMIMLLEPSMFRRIAVSLLSILSINQATWGLSQAPQKLVRTNKSFSRFPHTPIFWLRQGTC